MTYNCVKIESTLIKKNVSLGLVNLVGIFMSYAFSEAKRFGLNPCVSSPAFYSAIYLHTYLRSIRVQVGSGLLKG